MPTLRLRKSFVVRGVNQLVIRRTGARFADLIDYGKVDAARLSLSLLVGQRVGNDQRQNVTAGRDS